MKDKEGKDLSEQTQENTNEDGYSMVINDDNQDTFNQSNQDKDSTIAEYQARKGARFSIVGIQQKNVQQNVRPPQFKQIGANQFMLTRQARFKIIFFFLSVSVSLSL